jgi:hypothetical protein
MSAKSWLSVVLTGAAAVLGSVIGGDTPAIAASDNNPRTYAGDYQGGSLPIGTFIAFQYGSFAHADAFVDPTGRALPDSHANTWVEFTRVFDRSKRDDGTFSRSDFRYDPASDVYHCPAGKTLTTTGTLVNDGTTLLYLARKHDCDGCELKALCCPKVPFRRIPRDVHEHARDVARSSDGFLGVRKIDGRSKRVYVVKPAIISEEGYE